MALYLIVKRTEAQFRNKWQGKKLLELHTDQKLLTTINAHPNERIFIKLPKEGSTICCGKVEKVENEADGTFRVFFTETAEYIAVVPGSVEFHRKAYGVGADPIEI
jgi:hypothetical protein